MLLAMSEEEPSVGTPVSLALALIAAAIVIPMLRGGFKHGSLLGAAAALAALAPGGYIAWRGTQSKAQGKLLLGIVLMLGAVGLAAVLIVLRILSLLH
jgi:hypothetical protein